MVIVVENGLAMSSMEVLSNMMSGEVNVVRSMAEVSEIFLQISHVLDQRQGVDRTWCPWYLRAEDRIEENHFRIGSGAGFRAEWYMEATFANKQILLFTQEVACHSSEWMVEASVKTWLEEEETLIELPARLGITAEDVAGDLIGQARMLQNCVDEAVARFEAIHRANPHLKGFKDSHPEPRFAKWS